MKRLLLACLLALPLGAQPYRIAVVSMIHAHVWLHLGKMLKGDQVKLVGIAETLPDLVAHARREDVIPQTQGEKRPGVPESLIFADWKQMIDQTRPEIVWAFTETSRHVEVVEYCAPRGIHVIVEKPLAATYEQALAIQALARKHGIQVMTNYGSAWQPANYAAKAAVDTGAIGPIYRLRAVQGSGGPGDPRKSSFVAWLADPVKNGGGAMMDFGCYIVNWSLWLKGKPQSVYATVNHLKPELFPKVEDNATIILNYPDGVAILEASWDLPARPQTGNEIFGRDGSLVVSRTLELRKGSARQAEMLPIDPLPPERAEPIACMVNKLRTNQAVDGICALDLNVAVQEVLEAAKISARTGRAVSLPLR